MKNTIKSETVYCERFLSVFKEIDEKNISSYEQLQEYKHVDLYTEFWLATRDWVCNVALTSKTSNNGKEPGNLYKIDGIVDAGIADKNDIQSESLAHLISKFDRIVAQPHEARKPYCIKLVNNVVNTFGRQVEKIQGTSNNKTENDVFEDSGRKVKKTHGVTIISLQEKAKGKKVSAEDACTYENLIGDNCTPESKYSLQEDIREGKKVLLAKLAFLSKDSCRTLAFLSGHLNINPRVIAKLLLKKGIEATFDTVRKYTAETCEIPVVELKKVVNTENINLKKDPFKLSSNDEKTIADKISHLRNYGNDIISKRF